MKLNKVMKVIIAILLISLLAVTFSQIVMAQGVDIGGTYNNASDPTNTDQTVSKIISAILRIAQVVGVGVAVIMLVVLGIQYVSAAPEGKAEIKKNSTIYIVGAMVLFAAAGILEIIQRFAGIVNNGSSGGGNGTTP